MHVLTVIAALFAFCALLLRVLIALPGVYGNKIALALSGGDAEGAADVLGTIEVLYFLALVGALLMLVIRIPVLWQRPRRGLGLYLGAVLLVFVAVSGGMERAIYNAGAGFWRNQNPPFIRLVVSYDEREQAPRRKPLVERSLDSLNQRLQSFGQFHPPHSDGEARIALDLAAIEGPDLDRIRAGIDRGFLGFYLVVADDELAAEGQPADGHRLVEGHGRPMVIEDVPWLTGADIARAELANDAGRPAISLQFNDEGDRILTQLTANNIGRRLALVRDDRVLSSPIIKAPINTGLAVLAVDLSQEDTARLAADLAAGGLPARMTVLSESFIED